jgi:hypothetical protein
MLYLEGAGVQRQAQREQKLDSSEKPDRIAAIRHGERSEAIQPSRKSRPQEVGRHARADRRLNLEPGLTSELDGVAAFTMTLRLPLQDLAPKFLKNLNHATKFPPPCPFRKN